MPPRWIGSARLYTLPVLGTRVACSTTSGVRRLSIPRSSSAPKRPQLPLAVIAAPSVPSAAATVARGRRAPGRPRDAAGMRAPTNEVEVEHDVKVTMPDGVVLLTDVYHPVGVADAPTVLERTPYGRRGVA